jgi:membrane protein CcdC involved in cytochrome C biogenesis
MTATDWIIDIALIAIVLRQLREARLSIRTLLLPVILMAWAGQQYLHSVPTAGNDIALIAVFAVIGVIFGIAGGFLTRVRSRDGSVYIKATISAAALWVISMGFRLAFEIWASHSSGEAHLASFSIAHDITSSQAWVTALLLMAFGEVIFRLGIIFIRGQIAATRDSGGSVFAPAPAANAGRRG